MPADSSLDPRRCYAALVARDRRFDGHFFVGVASTDIYCRPVCPARTPLERNCRFFVSAAAAERRGFRPCLRCRPELAPHTHRAASAGTVATVDATRARALDAASRITTGALDAHSVPALAEALGTSPRQLRRVVTEAFGAPPVALAQTRRLLTAKQLLTESDLTMSQVALASGFGSIRRFNALFAERYGLAPHELRSRSRARASTESPGATHGLQLTLSLRPPYDWSAVCGFLAARAMPGVEHVTTGSASEAPRYARTVQWGRHSGTIAVTASSSTPELLRVEVAETLLPVLVPLLAQVREFLDLDASPDVISAQLGSDPLLAPLVSRAPGRRVPGAMDGFELAVRAVLGQQVSVRGASTLAARLVQSLAEPLAGTGTPHLSRLPLAAARVADASVEQIAAIGIPKSRAVALSTLARAVADGELPWLRSGGAPAYVNAGDTRAFLEAFTALPGIGPWTAQYVAMRALHAPDAFPDGDLVLRKAAGGLTAAQLARRADAWRPWRAYAAMHLWSSPS